MAVSDPAYYALKRLQSLTGLVPVGAFLCVHLFNNSFAVQSAEAYNRAGHNLSSIPYVQLLEIFGIMVPILFHAAIGVWIVATGQANARRYPYGRNWGYLLQRVTGVFLIFFIAWHVWSTRYSPAVMGGEEDLFGLMERALAHPGVFAFYVLGVLAATYHLGNGLFGLSIHWGLARGQHAQRTMAAVSMAVFLVLAGMGINSLLAFRGQAVRLFERVPAAPAAVAAAERSDR